MHSVNDDVVLITDVADQFHPRFVSSRHASDNGWTVWTVVVAAKFKDPLDAMTVEQRDRLNDAFSRASDVLGLIVDQTLAGQITEDGIAITQAGRVDTATGAALDAMVNEHAANVIDDMPLEDDDEPGWWDNDYDDLPEAHSDDFDGRAA